MVGILEKHRAAQRKRQRNAILEALAFVLQLTYDDLKKNPDTVMLDVEQRVRDACIARGIVISDDDLEHLAPDAISITDDGGPADAATKAVHRAVGRADGTIRNIRRNPMPLDLGRRAFGRFVPRKARAAYARTLHDDLLRETEAETTLRLSDLADLAETPGRILDRRIETMMRQVRALKPMWDANRHG